MKKALLLIVAAVLMLTSCGSSENNLGYFRNLAAYKQGALPQSAVPEIRIQPDNELVITISSAVPDATVAYNQPMTNAARRGELTTQGNNRVQTYIVDSKGNIAIPNLGEIYVKGKTTSEIAQTIKTMVSRDVKDPFVRIELLGFNVDVMGEVKSPHKIYVQQQRYTVLDALSDAGDLTEFGRRDNVMVIREVDGNKTFTRLNLASDSVFSSPCFYLQQNDVVYVEPNKIKIDNSKYNQNNAYKLSTISTVVSMASVIASLVIALTVK